MKKTQILLLTFALTSGTMLYGMETHHADDALTLHPTESETSNIVIKLLYNLLPKSWIANPLPEEKTLLEEVLENIKSQLGGCKDKFFSWIGQDCSARHGHISQTVNVLSDEHAQACLEMYRVGLQDLESFIIHNKDQLEQILSKDSSEGHSQTLRELVFNAIAYPQQTLASCLQDGSISLEEIRQTFPNVTLDHNLVTEFQKILAPHGTFCPAMTCSEPISCPTITCTTCPELFPSDIQSCKPSWGPTNFDVPTFVNQTLKENADLLWETLGKCPANHTVGTASSGTDLPTIESQGIMQSIMEWCSENPTTAISIPIVLFCAYKLKKHFSSKAVPAARPPAQLSALAQWAKNLPGTLAAVPIYDTGAMIQAISDAKSQLKKTIKKSMKEKAPATYKKIKPLIKDIKDLLEQWNLTIIEVGKLPLQQPSKNNLIAGMLREITAFCNTLESSEPFIQESLTSPKNNSACKRAMYSGCTWMMYLAILTTGIFIGSNACS